MRNKALITALLLFIRAVLLDGDVESTEGFVSSETSIRNSQKSIQRTPARNADCPDLNGTTQSPYFNINIANSHLINADALPIYSRYWYSVLPASHQEVL